MFSTTVFLQGFPLLMHAALATIGISLTGLLIGFFVAIGVCAARLSPNRAARMFGGAYINVIRSDSLAYCVTPASCSTNKLNIKYLYLYIFITPPNKNY